ncbi:MAG: hypothetical protein ACTSUE_01335 [Promethearchaeota archaeon]
MIEIKGNLIEELPGAIGKNPLVGVLDSLCNMESLKRLKLPDELLKKIPEKIQKWIKTQVERY